MSFSYQVKEELAKVMPQARHCRLAELAALVGTCGRIYTGRNAKHYILVSSENRNAIAKCQSLIKKIFDYDAESMVRYNVDTHNMVYSIAVLDGDTSIRILMATKLMDFDGSLNYDMSLVSTVGIQNMCCKRSFLRGAFVAAGSISDPEKSYHFEIVLNSKRKAAQIVDAMSNFELEGHVVERRRNYVVYLKEGSQIVDMLNVMGAHISLMELENVRVVKEVRNTVNRRVNCETANLGKTISAAVRQAEDIRYIVDTKGMDYLSEELAAVAELRLKYTDMPLKNLGELLNPPVGKSGVNHRLRKISEIAEELRLSGGKNND